MEPVLRAVGISKRFGGVTALDQVGIDLVPGEVHALVGENGAGKSTLIKILTGVYHADEGEITYRGEAVAPSSPRDAWDMGISTTFQEITLVPLMSVARNLYLGNEPRGRWGLLGVNEMNRNAGALLRRHGIDIDVRRPVRSFGAGVQQMIAIVRAVSTDALGGDPRRADVVARAPRSRPGVRHDPPVADGGGRPAVRQPQARRGVRDRRPDHDPA